MVNSLIIFVGVLLRVAFFTLLERKLLGFIHFRLGPRKILSSGYLQPITDAIKLFTKEIILKTKVIRMFVVFSPLGFIFLSLMYWIFYESLIEVIFFFNMVIVIFSIFRLNVYPLLIIGFISFSKFRISGRYRSISQTVSYEISLIIYILSFQLIDYSLNIYFKRFLFNEIIFFVFFSVLTLIWLTMCLIERNRTPFDLSEGESELVRGFNTEFEGGLFSMIFIGEYSSLLFLSSLTVLIFFWSSYFFCFYVFILRSWIIWVRGSLPRFRFDNLIIVAWKIFLPTSLLLFLIFL